MESSGSSSASGGGSKTNVGAIAGGVVGGVVGLAAIIGLAFFFLRRRKQQRAKAPSSAYLAPPMSSATPPLPPSTPGAFSEKTEFVPPNAPPTPKLYVSVTFFSTALVSWLTMMLGPLRSHDLPVVAGAYRHDIQARLAVRHERAVRCYDAAVHRPVRWEQQCAISPATSAALQRRAGGLKRI